MKRHVFALAVLAVTLPGLALAGEPVPMSDSDLDAVAAGHLVDHPTVAQVLADPTFKAGFAMYTEDSPAGAAFRATVNGSVRAQLRTLTPEASQILGAHQEDLGQVLPRELFGIVFP